MSYEFICSFPRAIWWIQIEKKQGHFSHFFVYLTLIYFNIFWDAQIAKVLAANVRNIRLWSVLLLQ